MIAIDTNILVYAHREDSEWHEAAYARVADLAELQFAGDRGLFWIALLPGESHCETAAAGKRQDLTPIRHRPC